MAESPSLAPASEPGSQAPTLAVLVEQGEQAIQNDRFADACVLFRSALTLTKGKPNGGTVPPDPYLVQRLALATYKAKRPDEVAALQAALTLLDPLDPKNSNDPETVGLAGAIEKRLYDKGQGADHLRCAIRHYGRGYFLRNDHYNGINLAYLLNLRTESSLEATVEDTVADLVWANRIRREVLPLCDRELDAIRARAERLAAKPDEDKKAALAREEEQRFWCLATKAEAQFGLGEFPAYEQTRSQARALKHAPWMMGTFEEQIQRLRRLLGTHGHL
jgi:hypothetical protein